MLRQFGPCLDTSDITLNRDFFCCGMRILEVNGAGIQSASQ